MPGVGGEREGEIGVKREIRAYLLPEGAVTYLHNFTDLAYPFLLLDKVLF